MELVDEQFSYDELLKLQRKKKNLNKYLYNTKSITYLFYILYITCNNYVSIILII